MRIGDKVLRVMQAERISAEELAFMLKHAAVTRIRACNRRYFLWVFRVIEHEGKIVQVADMQYADVVMVGRSQTRMLEDHESCNGDGCKACGWVGQIARGIADATAEALNSR